MLINKLDKHIRELQNLVQQISEKFQLTDYENEDKTTYPLKTTELKKLKVACIADKFTLDSYSPECILMELTPQDWKQEIDSFKPDLVLIESAWHGKDDLWQAKIVHCSQELFDLSSYCKKLRIPTVFWNKEDPAYTNSFMSAASIFDFVFTTDMDCIARYKKELGHNNVFHLHFAAQPAIHNPIEKYKRLDKFCFAGAYYHNYEERSRVFDNFAQEFVNTKGLEIYDRNYKNALPEHAFPPSYDSYIKGTLKGAEIDKAYKGYMYGINMNSIQQSQSMFARRIFELLASNTIAVGNYSRGLRNYFGDLTISTDDIQTLKNSLEHISGNIKKYRLLGLRKVLSEHLYEDRLDYIVQKVYGRSLKKNLPEITVAAHAASQKEFEKILSLFEKQTFWNKKLIVFSDCLLENREVKIFNTQQLLKTPIKHLINSDYMTVFDSGDYYGKNYLYDLILTTRYGNFDIIGKKAYYKKVDEKLKIHNPHNIYQITDSLNYKRSIYKTALYKDMRIQEIIDCKNLNKGIVFSTDEFNYCANSESSNEVEDIIIYDQGINLQTIQSFCESISSNPVSIDEHIIFSEELHKIIPDKLPSEIQIQMHGKEYMSIKSALPADKHVYVYLKDEYSIANHLKDGKITLAFNGSGTKEIIFGCIFYDKNKKNILHTSVRFNQTLDIIPPSEAVTFKFCMRLKGQNNDQLARIIIGNCKEEKHILSKDAPLILTNHYPSAKDLYRNMFVHRRVTGYKEAGFISQIMRFHPYATPLFREYAGIDIIEGQTGELESLLDKGTIKTICIHFLERDMWDVLKNYLDNTNLIIWMHGAEVQPWWRRIYNYDTEEALEQEKQRSAVRMQLWDEVFSEVKNRPDNLHFVFVSHYFANEVMEDYKVDLKNSYSIIHNFIDSDFFAYVPKPAEQRKKILSIKSYASAKYANDLTTQAIIELSKSPIFKNLEFSLYGDGTLFEKNAVLLSKYKNVHMYRKFLSPEEILENHHRHGIYIGTTRMDAQGVSRDEAMSSGLVPIANNVAAIPEFVDMNCGILVPEEDYKEIAAGIIKLYEDSAYFQKLSENASKRVRKQSSKEQTIMKEIDLIKNTGNL